MDTSTANNQDDDLTAFLTREWRLGKHGARLRCGDGRHVRVWPAARGGEVAWYFRLYGDGVPVDRGGPFETPRQAAQAAYDRLTDLPPPTWVALDEPYEPPQRRKGPGRSQGEASAPPTPRQRARQILRDAMAGRSESWTMREFVQAVHERWTDGARLPSDKSVRRAVDALVAEGVLTIVNKNRKTGYVYARRVRDHEEVQPCRGGNRTRKATPTRLCT